jgi:outer membrane immunogenic protein
MRRTIMTILVTAAFGLACPPIVLAADIAKPVYMKAPPPVPIVSWTGFYLGGDLGGSWFSNTATWDPLPSVVVFDVNQTSGKIAGAGFLGAVHAGYNWQFAPFWVVGLEGDWSWTHATDHNIQPWTAPGGGSPPPGSFTNMGTTLDWMSSLRGRFGYLVTPNLMAYATGGFAWAKFTYAATNSNTFTYSAPVAFSSSQPGFALGGGLEYAINSHWFARVEYLYFQFKNNPNVIGIAPAFPAFPSNYVWSATNVSVARAGLSYKF